jgi:hypothetical protein
VLVFLIVAIGVSLFVVVFGAVATESPRMRLLSLAAVAALIVGGGVALYLSSGHTPG